MTGQAGILFDDLEETKVSSIDSAYNAILGINITGVATVDRAAIQDVLKNRNITLEELLASLQRHNFRTTATPSGVSPDDGDSGMISVGLAVPIVLIVTFLVCVSACLYWHSRKNIGHRDNSASDKSVNTSFGRFKRSLVNRNNSTIDHVRESTRSTAPLRENIQDKVHVTALPFHDSQKFRFYWDKDNWKLYPQENLPGPQVNATRISVLRQQLSPINEIETSKPNDSFDVTHAYNVTAQAPFSPYHLTWVTPSRRNASESEVSTISKPLISQSLQTTNTSMSTESCSACVKYGKSISSPFFPHNNTPTTECADQDSSQAMKMNSELTTNTNNSRYTSYPSSPRSSVSPRSSAANSLTTSNLDTGVDASLVTSYQEPACPPSSMQSDIMPSADQSELYHSTNPTSEQQSQTESDFSAGVPSLPSSILYYHQKMTDENVMATGTIPYFSVSGMNCSMGSSLESSENNYVDNTSMLPNVGSSNTSGNPTGSIMYTSTLPVALDASQPLPITHIQTSTEDLSKIVNELSSIRVCSNEPFSIHTGGNGNTTDVDGVTGKSYFDGAQPSGTAITDGQFQQSITELFRSWSVTAELDFSSSSMEVFHRDDSKGHPEEKSNGVFAEDLNRNVIDLNKLPSLSKRFNLQGPSEVPLLTDKIYWV